jgi:uncharacterized membrane protein
MQNFWLLYWKLNKIDEKLETLKIEKKEQNKVINVLISLFLIFLLLFVYTSWFNSWLIKWSQIKDNNVLYFLKK